MDMLQGIQDWYITHCDGEREHHHCIKIESCDNPGWWVKIDLVGTESRSRAFVNISENVDECGFQQGERWLRCFVEDRVWQGAGDETKLAVILGTFLNWASLNPE